MTLPERTVKNPIKFSRGVQKSSDAERTVNDTCGDAHYKKSFIKKEFKKEFKERNLRKNLEQRIFRKNFIIAEFYNQSDRQIHSRTRSKSARQGAAST